VGARVVCVMEGHVYLDEIWKQDKIYIFGRHCTWLEAGVAQSV
jgi:hypothetical protein